MNFNKKQNYVSWEEYMNKVDQFEDFIFRQSSRGTFLP
jgi:hypothetical protein